MLKGIFSGAGSLIVALMTGEKVPALKYIVMALALGFVAYGLSIFTYIRAQKSIGAARTSAYYAAAPFIGAFLSFMLLKESLSVNYVIALLVMIAGSFFAVRDTLQRSHTHEHTHVIFHQVITHNHAHTHYINENNHKHKHK